MTEGEAKQRFDRDGFVILPSWLSSDDVGEMQERTHRYLSEVLPGLPEAATYRGTLKQLQRHDPWFRDYLENGPHRSLLETLIEDDLAPELVVWNDKPVDASFATPPHQDAVGSPRVPPSGCTLWIALDPVDRTNGCLHYGRGSHLRGLIKTFPIPDFDPLDHDDVPVELSPGDAVVHDARTIHWTDENRSDRSRRSIAFVYWGASSAIDPALARKFSRAGKSRAG